MGRKWLGFNRYRAVFREHASGRGIGARVQLEVADSWGDFAPRRGGLAPSQKRGVAAHRRPALSFLPPGRNPRRMGLKENDRRPRCIRHDSNSSRATAKSTSSGYRFVIQNALLILRPNHAPR